MRRGIRVPALFLCIMLTMISGSALANGGGMLSVNDSLQVIAEDGRIEKDWRSGASYGAGDMAVPRLFQQEYTNVLAVFRGEEKSVKSSGCGAVCISMVLAHLRSDFPQSPETIFRDACLAGYYQGNGLSLSTIRKLAQGYGIAIEQIGKYTGAIKTALSSGYPVIAYMGKGMFSNGGHYIVLRGITEDDMVRVNDPNSPDRSDTLYSLSLIVEQSKSDSPFLICKPASSPAAP